jgi:hypothetical protein
MASRRTALVSLIIIAFGITDAASVVRAQQCPPGRNVIIDPGLVPRRPRISPDAAFTARVMGLSGAEPAHSDALPQWVCAD